MLHARTGAHALHIACANNRTIAHAVAVFEFAIEHISEDFHVAMRMHAKTHARRDAIFIDHPQHAVMHMGWIVIIGKRETMPGLQPAMIGMTALTGFT